MLEFLDCVDDLAASCFRQASARVWYNEQRQRRCKLKKIKVLIAEDHAVVREGTRRILNQEEDMEVVAEARGVVSDAS